MSDKRYPWALSPGMPKDTMMSLSIACWSPVRSTMKSHGSIVRRSRWHGAIEMVVCERFEVEERVLNPSCEDGSVLSCEPLGGLSHEPAAVVHGDKSRQLVLGNDSDHVFDIGADFLPHLVKHLGN